MVAVTKVGEAGDDYLQLACASYFLVVVHIRLRSVLVDTQLLLLLMFTEYKETETNSSRSRHEGHGRGIKPVFRRRRRRIENPNIAHSGLW